jgi:hypothetical protein
MKRVVWLALSLLLGIGLGMWAATAFPLNKGDETKQDGLLGPFPTDQTPPASQKPNESQSPSPEPSPSEEPPYSNDAFRNVTVTKTGDRTYEVKGEASVFEAMFSYVVEDGHDELTSGHVQTSLGAPGWGEFSFTFTVPDRDGSVHYTLILFEPSAMDGSRTHQLVIPLPE